MVTRGQAVAAATRRTRAGSRQEEGRCALPDSFGRMPGTTEKRTEDKLAGQTMLRLAGGVTLRRLNFDLQKISRAGRRDYLAFVDMLSTGRTLEDVHVESGQRPSVGSLPTEVLFDARCGIRVHAVSADALRVLQFVQGRPATVDTVIARLATQGRDWPRVLAVIRSLVKQGVLSTSGNVRE